MIESGFDLSGLSPEELQQLTIHAIQTSQECAEQINQLSQALVMLVDKVHELDEHTDKLDNVLMNDLIGGIDSLYKENQHGMMIDGLKSKYGELFEPHMGMIKDFYPDLDIYEKLGEEQEGMRGSMGDSYSDEAFDARIKEIADALAAKAGKYKMAKEEIPAAVAVEKTTVAPAAEELAAKAPDAGADIIETVKRLKSNKNPISLA